jgi:hypothetical protein
MPDPNAPLSKFAEEAKNTPESKVSISENQRREALGVLFLKMHILVYEFRPSRERSLVRTKLDEAELWMTRVEWW